MSAEADPPPRTERSIRADHVLSRGRSSGILLPIFSLPGGPIGDFGPAARAFVDRLADAGQSWWQTLPLGPTTPSCDHSPYSVLSTAAMDPVYLSIADLIDEGWIEEDPGGAEAATHTETVDYESARERARAALVAAARRLEGSRREDCESFRESAGARLEEWALFVALREASGQGWTQWSAALRDREPSALAEARRVHSERIELEVLTQFLLRRQWDRLRDHAHHKGVRLFGDLPMYVFGQGVDVWMGRDSFRLDEEGRETHEAGVPPDDFAVDGQKWGSPVYDWAQLEEDGFSWWTARIEQELERFDLLRLDHFRGFSGYWSIPTGESAGEGEWEPGPGAPLFDAIANATGLERLIAEDLGEIDDDVRDLLEGTGIPGMRVVQFGFGEEEDEFAEHLPENYGRDVVAYTGTHDNTTLLGWLAELGEKAHESVLEYLAARDDTEAHRALVEAVVESRSVLAILPLQDALGLDAQARVNQPGTLKGNWRWRLRASQLEDRGWVEWLREITLASERAPHD